MEKQIILKFLKEKHFCVLATVTEQNTPAAAVMGFGVTDDLELIFGTTEKSRKYQNIKQNPHVAFAIGWDEFITVQFEGVAEQVEGEEAERLKAILFEQEPAAKQWENLPGEHYFKVKPTFIKYSNYTVQPPEFHELTF